MTSTTEPEAPTVALNRLLCQLRLGCVRVLSHVDEPATHALMVAAADEIEQLLEALTTLCDKVEDTDEHGGDSHDGNCSVCAALASGRALLLPNASLRGGEAVALKR